MFTKVKDYLSKNFGKVLGIVSVAGLSVASTVTHAAVTDLLTGTNETTLDTMATSQITNVTNAIYSLANFLVETVTDNIALVIFVIVCIWLRSRFKRHSSRVM